MEQALYSVVIPLSIYLMERQLVYLSLQCRGTTVDSAEQ